MMGDRGFLGEAMDIEKPPALGEEGGTTGSSTVFCSICLDVVSADTSERSVAKLQCGHEFHLDCIGSAFNAKGAMQCPNCRKVEKGRWLYVNGYRSFPEFNVDEIFNEDLYDMNFSETTFGFHWCPFRGLEQLASLFEVGEAQANAFGGIPFGDMSSSSSSAHVCPYLTLRGFHHAEQPHPATTNPGDDPGDTGLFHRHLTGMAGRSSIDAMDPQDFTTESQHHNWQQQPSFPITVPGNSDQSASYMSSRLSGDSSGQQRLGNFVHHHRHQHGSVMHNRSNIATSAPPPNIGDARGGPNNTHGGHIFRQPHPLSSIRNGAFHLISRTRPRGMAFISPIATTSSAEIGGFYGFSLSRSAGEHRQDGVTAGRHLDCPYGWGREGFPPFPWMPLEGQPHWWGPFQPNADSASRSYFPQWEGAERALQGRPESGYQRTHVPRMPPFM